VVRTVVVGIVGCQGRLSDGCGTAFYGVFTPCYELPACGDVVDYGCGEGLADVGLGFCGWAVGDGLVAACDFLLGGGDLRDEV